MTPSLYVYFSDKIAFLNIEISPNLDRIVDVTTKLASTSKTKVSTAKWRHALDDVTIDLLTST